MTKVPTDQDREHRITYEVIVDCYDEYEVAMGWYYYLADRLDFPFEANWLGTSQSQSQTVQVIGMADEEECQTDIFVEIEYREGDGVRGVLVQKGSLSRPVSWTKSE